MNYLLYIGQLLIGSLLLIFAFGFLLNTLFSLIGVYVHWKFPSFELWIHFLFVLIWFYVFLFISAYIISLVVFYRSSLGYFAIILAGIYSFIFVKSIYQTVKQHVGKLTESGVINAEIFLRRFILKARFSAKQYGHFISILTLRNAYVIFIGLILFYFFPLAHHVLFGNVIDNLIIGN